MNDTALLDQIDEENEEAYDDFDYKIGGELSKVADA